MPDRYFRFGEVIVLEDMGNILSSRILRGKDDPDVIGVGRWRGSPAPDVPTPSRTRDDVGASPLRLVQHDILKVIAKAYSIHYLPVLLAYNIRQF